MNTLNKQIISLPPVAVYITQVAIDTATSDVWEILSVDFAILSPD